MAPHKTRLTLVGAVNIFFSHSRPLLSPWCAIGHWAGSIILLRTNTGRVHFHDHLIIIWMAAYRERTEDPTQRNAIKSRTFYSNFFEERSSSSHSLPWTAVVENKVLLWII